MEEELLRLEDEFARAVASNDTDALDGLLADDWIIVEPDGGMIDKARFLGVIRSGALSHESMESTPKSPCLRKHRCGNGTNGHQREVYGTGFCVLRTGDRYFREAHRTLAMRIYAAN